MFPDTRSSCKLEKDLFGPIKEYFENKGYVCDGEVADIDLFAEKLSADKPAGKKRKKDGQTDTDPERVVVELKVNLDFRSVQQAAQRQKMFETVYIGIFRPKDFSSRSFKD